MRAFTRSLPALLSLWVACNMARRDAREDTPPRNMVQLALTLPSGAAIDEVGYTITNTGFERTSTVDVHASSMLRIMIGALPVANGYTLALSATTLDGALCSGQALFDISNTQVTPVAARLECREGSQPVDNAGDISVNAQVTSAPSESCPVVTGLSAAPLQVSVGGSIALEAFTSSPASGMWASYSMFGGASSAGTFADPTAAATTLICESPGQYRVSYAVNRPGCDVRTQALSIDCTRALCGNGTLDPGEECDDGNGVSADGCSPACTREPVCAVDFPCFRRTAQCVGSNKIQATRSISCEEVCGTPICSGGACGGTGPVLDCPAGEVCVDVTLGPGPFDKNAECMPPECSGRVCPENIAMCGFQAPNPPECLPFCAMGECCENVEGAGWIKIAVDCPVAPDAGL